MDESSRSPSSAAAQQHLKEDLPLLNSMSSKTFPRNPSLSNSKFETYKLSHPKASTSSIPLPGAHVTQARVQHGKTTLSAHEVGSRIRHDHLQKCFGGWLGWVDEEWEMWAMKLKTVGSGSFSTLQCSSSER